MKAVLDTNVFVSGVFFRGPPHAILDAWRRGQVQVVLSAEIIEEYRRVGALLAADFPGVDLAPMLGLLAVKAEVVAAPPLPEAVCDDPDDDKFLACALAGRCRTVISGDRALLRVSGYRGITVLRPREFVARHLTPP